MKVPLSWLRDYVDVDIPPMELADKLTMAGLEVSGVEQLGAGWDNVFVGEVLDLEKHPNADRLLVSHIDYGRGILQVVTGAMNMHVGDKVPVALPGARLIDGHSEEKKYVTLKPGKLRGIESEGMACSEKELGLSEEHEGIMILDKAAPVGEPLANVLGDVILDLEITPNLAHDLSIVGIAREVAALTGKVLRLPSSDWQEGEAPLAEFVNVEVADPELAPRYCLGLIRNVEVKDSPKWMQDRLAKAGERPINNVVDITNYVMLEWGQPQHAFDYDQVKGHKVIVRRARPGETITTIDHVEREVTPEMLMIADAEEPIGVAGVMGGLSSEIGPETKNILLESANFDRISIRRTSRALRLRTEASYRFERGIDPEMALPALRRAAELMRELAGGTIARGAADVYSTHPEVRTIRLTTREVERVLGMSLPVPRMVEILKSLDFQVKVPGISVTAGPHQQFGEDEHLDEGVTLLVTVPSFRGDVTLPADLIEELARVQGYDQIPVTLMADELPEQHPNERRDWESKIRDLLMGAGLNEAISYSLTSIGTLSKLRPVEAEGSLLLPTVYGDVDIKNELVRVANPLSAERDVMRPVMMASMLETLAANMRHEDRAGLFELGKVYLWRGPGVLPVEKPALSIGLAGRRTPKALFGDETEMDFFDIKGIVDALLSHLSVHDVRFEPAEVSMLHPGRSAKMVVGENVLGLVGEISPEVVEAFEVRSGRVCLLEIDLEELHQHAAAEASYTPVQRFPGVEQDIAVVIDESIPAQKVYDLLQQAGGGMLRSVTIFDVYSGPPIPEGKKSLAFSLLYQVPGRTLTDKEVNRQRERLEQRLKKELGAELRAQ